MVEGMGQVYRETSKQKEKVKSRWQQLKKILTLNHIPSRFNNLPDSCLETVSYSFLATERTENSEKNPLKISVNSVFSVAKALFHAFYGLMKRSLRQITSLLTIPAVDSAPEGRVDDLIRFGFAIEDSQRAPRSCIIQIMREAISQRLAFLGGQV
jgi:hypothetical protein